VVKMSRLKGVMCTLTKTTSIKSLKTWEVLEIKILSKSSGRSTFGNGIGNLL